MEGLEKVDKRIKKILQKKKSMVGEKAAFSLTKRKREKGIEREREREGDSIRADYKHKSPLCPMHVNLHASVVQ